MYLQLQMMVIDLEVGVMMALSGDIVAAAPTIHRLLGYAAELDCFLGLAEACLDYNLTKPTLLPPRPHEIAIVNGRHLIQVIVYQAIKHSYSYLQLIVLLNLEPQPRSCSLKSKTRTPNSEKQLSKMTSNIIVDCLHLNLKTWSQPHYMH